jgi:hypothetical protein
MNGRGAAAESSLAAKDWRHRAVQLLGDTAPAATFPTRSSALLAGTVVIGCLATVLVAIPEILLPDSDLSWVDAWFYVSFMHHLPEKLAQYSYLYQAERLAWTLPGYLANQVASPLAANYLVKSAFFVTSLLALFGTLRYSCSVRTCAFVTALAGSYSFFLHSIGAQYSDGAANTYFLLAIYAATRAARGEGSEIRFAFLSGICYLAVLQAHLSFLLIAPFFAAYVIAVRLRSGRLDIKGLEAIAFSFLGGMFVAYLAVVAVYLRWRVPHAPMWVSLQVFYAHPENPLIWPDTLEWILVSFWLVMPTTAAVWIGLSYATALREGWRGVVRRPDHYWFLLAMYGIWVLAYFVQAPVIMVPFYASYLIPLTFLALGPLVAPMLDQLSTKSYAYLLCLLFGVVAAAYLLSNPAYAGSAVLIAIGCLAAATLMLSLGPAGNSWRPTAFAALLVVAFGGINFASADYSTQIRNAYKNTAMATYYPEPRPGSPWTASRAEAFEGAIHAAEKLKPRLSGKTYYFLYDGNDPMGMFFRSIGSLHFAWQLGTLLGEGFDGVDDGTVKALMARRNPPGDLLILTRDADVPVSDTGLNLQWTEAFRTAGTDYYAHYFVVDGSRAGDRAH